MTVKTMRQVMIFPKGQLWPSFARRLSRAGIIAFEVDDPSRIRVIDDEESNADELLGLALKALATSDVASKSFGHLLIERLQKQLKATV